jgi:hypothetical protein
MSEFDFLTVSDFLDEFQKSEQFDLDYLSRALWMVARYNSLGNPVDVDHICENFGYPSTRGAKHDQFLEMMAELCVYNLDIFSLIIKQANGSLRVDRRRIKELGGDIGIIGSSPEGARKEILKMWAMTVNP